MSSKLTGATLPGMNGETLDTPAAGLVASPPELLQWSRELGCPIVLPDIQITRRLRCHIAISYAERTVKAFGNWQELNEWLAQQSSRQYAIAEELVDKSLIAWYVNNRTVHLRE